MDGNVATFVSRDDFGTTTSAFAYQLGNLTSIDVEGENNDGDDENSRIDVEHLADEQENVGALTFIQGATESTIELTYDQEGLLDEQVLETTLSDGSGVTATAEFDYDDDRRISSIEHRGSIDGGAEVVIGD